MISIRQTHDLELVREIVTHPSQYPAATDDASPRREDFRPNADPRIIYLEARGHFTGLEDTAGIFTLVPRGAVCYEIHAAILPRAWGWRTKIALAAAIAWMFQNTPARRIVAEIPRRNQLAIALARRAGMAKYGVNYQSFLKHGRLEDVIELGISKD